MATNSTDKTIAFHNLNLRPELLLALTNEFRFQKPTDIQWIATPQIAAGKDVLCQGGSGKTTMAMIAALQCLQEPKDGVVQSLIVCRDKMKTVELLNMFNRTKVYMPPFTVNNLFGADRNAHIGMFPQVPDICITFLAHLAKMAKQNQFPFNHIRQFITDDCDKIGQFWKFVPEFAKFFSFNVQSVFIAYDLTAAAADHCRTIMRHSFFEVNIHSQRIQRLQHLYFFEFDPSQLDITILEIIEFIPFWRAIVYANTPGECQKIRALLSLNNLETVECHSAMSYNEHMAAVDEFNKMEFGILLATGEVDLTSLSNPIDLLVTNSKTHAVENFLSAGKTGIFHKDGKIVICLTCDMRKSFPKKLKRRYRGIEITELLLYEGVFNELPPDQLDSDEEKEQLKAAEQPPPAAQPAKITIDYSSGGPVVHKPPAAQLPPSARTQPVTFDYSSGKPEPLPPAHAQPMRPHMKMKPPKQVARPDGPRPSRESFPKDIVLFDHLNLKRRLRPVLLQLELFELTKIQKKCFKHALNRKDLIYQAEMGSGKTTLYVLSILENLDPHPDFVQAIVIVGNTERANIVADKFKIFGVDLGVRVLSTFSEGPEKLKQALKQSADEIASVHPHIIISSLELLRNMLKKDVIDLSNTRHLVLDRFEDTSQIAISILHMQELLRNMPSDRQLIISCEAKADFMKPYYSQLLRNPLEVILQSDKTSTASGEVPSAVSAVMAPPVGDKLKHFFIPITPMDKEATLILLLRQCKANHIIVFVDSDASCMGVLNHLAINNYNVLTIHSFIRKEAFDRIFAEFTEAGKCVLVTTGLFGRRLDNVDVVLNYDAPSRTKRYVERMDGCGMEKGSSKQIVTFVCSEDDEGVLDRVEDNLNIKIKKLLDSDLLKNPV